MYAPFYYYIIICTTLSCSLMYKTYFTLHRKLNEKYKIITNNWDPINVYFYQPLINGMSQNQTLGDTNSDIRGP